MYQFCRKNFRPAYGKLSLLTSFFPTAPVAALTATATRKTCRLIQESISLRNPVLVSASPDRPNIYLGSFKCSSSGYEKLCEILQPYVDELCEKKTNMPMTLIYFRSLEECGESFLIFSSKMGALQYYPAGAEPISSNRLFAQYHAHYPSSDKEALIKGLISGALPTRVIFATIAFGMGIDLPNIRKVVHVGLPSTMEEYLQEVGRAGRDGLYAEALTFYDAYSVRKQPHGRGVQDDIIKLVTRNDICKREVVLEYFGHKTNYQHNPVHLCCDFHKSCCSCIDCQKVESDVDIKNVDNQEAPSSAALLQPVRALSDKAKDLLRRRLFRYRESLGCSRSCVGSVSYSSGFSIELINESIKLCDYMDSVQAIEQHLPVFSKDHAKVIYNLIEDVNVEDII